MWMVACIVSPFKSPSQEDAGSYNVEYSRVQIAGLHERFPFNCYQDDTTAPAYSLTNTHTTTQ